MKDWGCCQRNRVVAALIARVALSLLIGSATTLLQCGIAQTNFDDAKESREAAVKSQQETQTAWNESESCLARIYVERGLQKIDVNPHAGLPWLIKALKMQPRDSPEHQVDRLRIGMMLCELPTLLGFWPEATSANFSADGTKLAIAIGSEVRVFQLPEMKSVPVMRHVYPVTSVTFTSQGDRLASVSRAEGSPPWCRIWDASTGEPATKNLNLTEREYQLRDTPTIHFTPDGERFVAVYAGMYNRWHTKMATRMFDSRTLQQVSPTFAHHSDLDYPSGYHRLSPDAQRVLLPRGVPADDPDVAWNNPKFPRDMDRPQQYDLMTGKPVHPPLEHTLDFYGNPVYSSDGSRIATSEDGLVKVWDAANGSLINKFPLSAEVKRANVQFHPDGTSLFVIENRKASWRDIATGAVKQAWTHENKFYVDPTGRFKVWADTNGENYIQDMTREDAGEVRLPDLYRVRFCPDGSRFLLKPKGHYEAGLSISPPDQLFRSADCRPISPPWRFSGGEADQPFSHDGRYFLTQLDTGVWLWDLDRQRKLIETFPPNRSASVIDAATNRSRRRCAVLSRDLTISCWDTETGERLYEPFQITLPSPTDTASQWQSMTLNDAGDAVAIVGEYRAPTPEDKTRDLHLIQVWNLKTGRLRFDPLVFDQEPNSWVTGARFLNHDQRLVVTEHLHRWQHETKDDAEAHDWTRLHLIDAVSGVPLQEPREFEHTFRLLGFTPDQDQALVFREDDRWPIESRNSEYSPPLVQMFDTKSWESVTEPMAPDQGPAWNATLSPDGTRIIMGNAEVWDALTGKRLVPALVAHRSVGEIVFHDDGQMFIAVIDGGRNHWDAPAEIYAFASDGKSRCPPMTCARTGEAHCAIHRQHRIIAAAGKGLRLWDGWQGTALSGVYRLHGNGNQSRVENRHRSTFFTPRGDRLYIEAGHELAVVRWNEFVESLPPDDILEAWAGILSGKRIDQTGGLIPLTAAEFEQAWHEIAAADHD